MASEATFRQVHHTRRCSSPTNTAVGHRFRASRTLLTMHLGACPPNVVPARHAYRCAKRDTAIHMQVLSSCRTHKSAQSLTDQHQRSLGQDSLAEWSKALAPGASPQGRGFEPHSCHFCFTSSLAYVRPHTCCWICRYIGAFCHPIQEVGFTKQGFPPREHPHTITLNMRLQSFISMVWYTLTLS